MKINIDTIVKDNKELIREKSENVRLQLSDDDKETLMSLYHYVVDSTDPEKMKKENLRPAVGIAAIQVGIKKKMIAIVIKGEDDKIIYQYALANPRIVSHSVEEAYLANGEGCLSVESEHEGYIYRHRRIKVKAYDLLQDKEVIIKASDYLAIVFQHELDHFNGILFYDHINKENPFFVKKEAFRIE